MQRLRRMYEIQDNTDKVNECNVELEEIKKAAL
jgi:hypothetical protein